MANRNGDAMEVVPGEEPVEVDELKEAFDSLEESIAPDAKGYDKILASPRMDDVAIKIKEQCIYK
jgi:hypothetical protein